jgi:hypothetical protein
MLTIYDIEFSQSHDDFIDGLRNFLSNYGNGNMTVNSIEHATKNGRYMYKIEVTNQDDPNATTMLFEKNVNNGDIVFVPTGFRSFGGTFYKVENLSENVESTSDDTSIALMDYLEKTAKQVKGKLVYKIGSQVTCIVNGNSKGGKECIVDSNGNVYGAKEVSSVSLSDTGAHVSFNTQIGEWNKQRKLEDPDFAAQLNDKTTSMVDKMNYIGRYVVELKAKDEIESEEFKDVFIQAGLFTSGFSNDKTLSMIYKLLN